LIVVVGPTAVGKTALSIALAQHFKTEIVSADSRQMYREMKIGTAMPDAQELASVPHHFIGQLSIHDPYSAGDFEIDALHKLDELFQQYNYVVLTGGSGLYVKAVTHGLDEHPSDVEIREQLIQQYAEKGLSSLQELLKKLDPATYERIDLNNHQRIIRALEVCLVSGKPYSSFLTHEPKPRNFQVIEIGLELERTELVQRINQRVDQMVAQGLVEEARALYPHRNLNALQTVGYKELFRAFAGECSLEEAIESIKVNTRRFAKRQMTWFRKNTAAYWAAPDELEEVIEKIESTGEN